MFIEYNIISDIELFNCTSFLPLKILIETQPPECLAYRTSFDMTICFRAAFAYAAVVGNPDIVLLR